MRRDANLQSSAMQTDLWVKHAGPAVYLIENCPLLFAIRAEIGRVLAYHNSYSEHFKILLLFALKVESSSLSKKWNVVNKIYGSDCGDPTHLLQDSGDTILEIALGHMPFRDTILIAEDNYPVTLSMQTPECSGNGGKEQAVVALVLMKPLAGIGRDECAVLRGIQRRDLACSLLHAASLLNM